jgi:nitroimidazol reductase NimA-like FMN-containing flavoprotein (pyridoxamine 5'-phosphate oxidase superfamily)
VTDRSKPARPGIRLSDDEIWAFVTEAHTGIMTTLRRDGMPISLPVWFACVDHTIWLHTRGKKLVRVRNDPRSSFLVESGERWAELKAVHFTGRADLVGPDPATKELIATQLSRKYDAFRTPSADMTRATAEAYASSMTWVRFTPDDRVLSWDNARLIGDRT